MAQGIKSILIQAPTGFGKTVLAAYMLKTAAAKDMDSYFVVHRRELIKQSMRTFDKVGVHHGIIANGFVSDPRARVQIAGIQTLVNRYHKYRRPSLIIWDEARHLAASSWSKIYQAFPDAFHIGLDATPERLDGKGLADYFQAMVKGPSVRQLILNGHLSPYRAYAPAKPDLAGVHTRMGDYVRSELASALDRPTITGNAINEYKTRAPGTKAIMFCVSIEHSKHAVDQFNAAGIRAEHVDGETDPITRDQALARFERGETMVLSNVDLFGEGFDVPSAQTLIDLAPTMSLGRFLQRCGRVLRYVEGKTAIILDHAGNIERHGLPDEEREWSLAGRDTSKRSSLVKTKVKVCPKCFAAQMLGKPVCSYCGYQFEIKSREVDEAEGELQEITPEELERRRRERQQRMRQEQGRAQTMQELIELGKKKGLKNPYGWARHVFAARQRKKLGGA